MDDLRLLKVLREVALRGSFSAAAESLSYSQPAVSQQIARLEAQTGVKLIERQPKGIKLTPAGEALVRHTEQILAQLAHAQAELTEIASDARGKLRLASFATAAGTIVPRAVSEFRHLRPGVHVELSLMDPPQSIPALRRGEFDIVITEEGGFESDISLDGLGVERLMDDVLYASLPAEHPLATRRAIALTDLCEEEWMLVGLRGTCADSNIVLRACQDAGLRAARGVRRRTTTSRSRGWWRAGWASRWCPAWRWLRRATTSRCARCAGGRPTGGSARSSLPIRWDRSQ